MGLKLDENSLIEQERRCQRGKPGPGTYNPDFSKLVHSSGGFSLKGKSNLKEENRAPGPGAYKSQDASLKQSFKFPSSPQREPVEFNGQPGPGNYNIPCEIGNMPQYTMARPKEFAYI